jgi:hypothetical protein
LDGSLITAIGVFREDEKSDGRIIRCGLNYDLCSFPARNVNPDDKSDQLSNFGRKIKGDSLYAAWG